MAPTLKVVRIFELNGRIDSRHNLHSTVFIYMTTMKFVFFKELGRIKQFRAGQTGILLALFTGPPERTDIKDRGEMVDKPTVISRST
jgi:hypothetical protein